ncbi:MoxR family ATPase [Candidatus Woesearchaeota archaeon]|nr:MoxR family ATPase [Candidatus Woesearchaeota archaeon]
MPSGKKEVKKEGPQQEEDFAKVIQEDLECLQKVRDELSKVVVGQEEIVNSFLKAFVCSGHVLIEGIPGIAKTLIVRSLASVVKCSFSRIQFTPDLLPTDIVGITSYDDKKGFYVVKGPIFHNIILADEINRAPPKVQSALLEAMQERQVTIGKETFMFDSPFFVLATQNPLEQLGTYPLPEAQIDRFLFKLNIGYPSTHEEEQILHKNITLNQFEHFNLQPVLTPERMQEMQQNTKKIYLDKKVEKYIVRIVDATRHPDKYAIRSGKLIAWGASPRASIGIFIASKAQALFNGRTFVTPQDVKDVALDVLRHRIILNYEGQASGISTDDVIHEVLSRVPIS